MVTVADSTLRRRRAIEACAFTARAMGMLVTLSFTAGVPHRGGPPPAPDMLAGCVGALVAMAAANVLAATAFVRPATRWYRRFSAGQVGLDTLVVAAVAMLSELNGTHRAWPALVVPIVVGALRHQLAGALVVWSLTSAAYGAAAVVGGGTGQDNLLLVVTMNLVVALVSGTQSSAFARQLKSLQEVRRQLQHQAAHDPLTGLPNRARLSEYAARHTGAALAVLLLDLDGFKKVNDTMGHAAGDELLREVAERLETTLGERDMAGRLGGDEFLVLLPDADAAQVMRVADRVRAAIRRPITLQTTSVRVGVSIGAALRPAGADTSFAALTAQADTAMYADKRAAPAA